MKKKIKTEAKRLGFSFCGIAKAETLEHLRPFYSSFIENEGHAGFPYLKFNFEKRMDPGLVMEGTKSVIAVMMNYYPPDLMPEEDNFIIAKYAYGKDYHPVMRDRMNLLINFIQSQSPVVKAIPFVDSGPVLEKAWAQRSGIGWQGRNTLIINKTAGSFFFIGIIYTNLDLKPDRAATNHCGDCMRCVEACPTGALNVPYQLNIRKCISYYTTIKKKTAPPEIAMNMSNRIYGCDICQDVCPYNRFSKPHHLAEFTPGKTLFRLRKKDWANISHESFDCLFAGTPLERTGYQQLIRSIACQHK